MFHFGKANKFVFARAVIPSRSLDGAGGDDDGCTQAAPPLIEMANVSGSVAFALEGCFV